MQRGARIPFQFLKAIKMCDGLTVGPVFTQLHSLLLHLVIWCGFSFNKSLF